MRSARARFLISYRGSIGYFVLPKGLIASLSRRRSRGAIHRQSRLGMDCVTLGSAMTRLVSLWSCNRAPTGGAYGAVREGAPVGGGAPYDSRWGRPSARCQNWMKPQEPGVLPRSACLTRLCLHAKTVSKCAAFVPARAPARKDPQRVRHPCTLRSAGSIARDMKYSKALASRRHRSRTSAIGSRSLSPIFAGARQVQMRCS